ncbi:phosphodiesterase [Geotoga petraea]|uniref:Phosphoesterase n=1 Tax=Geotoga petraea TaxID=28234 RepID=A0A4Z0VYY8_9BACT|nr:phosphodiesterase [Geotoga petraea]
MINLKLGVISDVHGSSEYLVKALKSIGIVDRYLLLGDVLYHGARNDLPEGYNPKKVIALLKDKQFSFITGNCDSQIDHHVLNIPEPIYYKTESYNDINIFMTHGWTPKIQEAIEMAKELKCNVLLYGHTHIPEFTKNNGIYVINPGSISLPKEDSKHTAIRIEIGNNKYIVEFIDIIKDEVYKREELEI